jgi:ATP-dependent DNA helicase RecG
MVRSYQNFDKPNVIPDIYAVSINQKEIVVVAVSEYPIKPVNSRGKYFQRKSASNHQLLLSEITNVYMQTYNFSWDSYEAPRQNVDELSIEKIEKFIEQVNKSGRFHLDSSPLFALEKLRFIVNQKPTLASILLFAKEPMRHHIHIGRFKTSTNIIDDRQITDTLFEAVDAAMKFIISYIGVSFEFDGSLQRKERFAYPLPAIREAFLNAVVHRDYANASDIQIKIFDDKITIFSPGKLYDGITVDALSTDNYQSRIRNKLIAEAFYLTKNIEKYGSGFIRIRKELETYPEVSFQVEEISGGVLISFLQKAVYGGAKPINIGTSEVRAPIGGVNYENGGIKKSKLVKSGGKTDDLAVLNLIKILPGLRSGAIALELGAPKRTIERRLKGLKNDGKIVFRGAPKNGGYYENSN